MLLALDTPGNMNGVFVSWRQLTEDQVYCPIDGCQHVGRKDNLISKNGHIATQHPDSYDDYVPESRNKNVGPLMSGKAG